jgi:rubrerythrin
MQRRQSELDGVITNGWRGPTLIWNKHQRTVSCAIMANRTMGRSCSMREPLLTRHPEARAVTLRDLVGIANAIEQEAVRRYGQLAELMERAASPKPPKPSANAAGGAAHVAVRGPVGEGLNEAVPPPEEFEWQLPPEIGRLMGRDRRTALLTPYRAFSIAVRNEERAFSLYIYLSAHAEDARVASEADKLAGEELEHAALLRRWRRAAYHKDQGGQRRARREDQHDRGT